MMNMMNTTGPSFSLLFFPFQTLTCLAIGIGVVFLVIWAIKTLTPAQLKKWGLGLLIGGIVAYVLTYSLVFPVSRTMYQNAPNMKMMNMEMMDDMMDMDDDDMMMGHSMHDDDMMSMSMDDMAEMLQGKTGDAFDQAFIEGMIPHHQGAIDMARAAQQSAKHQEIKDMAEDIISAQQREIDMMRGWQRAWGYAE